MNINFALGAIWYKPEINTKMGIITLQLEFFLMIANVQCSKNTITIAR